ncbi:hypothetical protein A3N68_14355 [Enterobacter asburiae]|uniref:hypothetical protein n=1 Tax=Enterobacter asburiae TaxID=61645 RepID=UPI0007B39AAD|nr:hypothetical protein [Enterobacter asburiae]KZR46946.1 hypothetical protein A3N68_14355 [Enterobacter asburiae]
MSKQNAVDLTRTARSEAESITKGDKRTITAIINNWNECVKQAGFWCIYDFPTTGYTRKSQLVADLLSCADQLDEYVEPNPHAAQTIEQQTRELNAALTRVLDVEEAHAEALIENDDFDGIIRDGLTPEQRAIQTRREGIDIYGERFAEMYARDYAEALEMNVGIELALHIITKMGGCEGAGDAAGGCLYRDGFNEINYLVSLALSLYEKRENEHAEAIEEDKRYTWLVNRWSLFWAGCDYFTRRTMLEEAHAEALRIDAEQYAAPVNCSIFQRNDGVQLALDSSCDVRFIRTSKNGEWFKVGFRNTYMEGYQPVESNVVFSSMPSRTLSYSDGVMVVSEA